MTSLTRPDFRHARTVPRGDFRFIALDVETACGEAGSICQIGIACVQPDNRIQTFSMLVNPATRFDSFNIRLHGIGPDHVADAPFFPDALARLLPLLERHHLIQHSSFDKRAIHAACAICGLDTPALRWSDSVTIARRAWPELKGNGGHGLANLKKVLDLQFHHHDAGEDARAAAMVVLHAETHLSMPFDQLIAPAPKARRSRARKAGPPDPDGARTTGETTQPFDADHGPAAHDPVEAGGQGRSGSDGPHGSHRKGQEMIERMGIGARASQIVKYRGVAYISGQVGEGATIQEQTEECLRRVEALLLEAGSSREQMLRATIWLADMSDFDGLNEVWNAWVPEGHAPARACGEAKLASPEFKVEIIVDAAFDR